jgi:PAS domain S-box-containing protein
VPAARILIVEDEHIVSLFLRGCLEKLEYGISGVVTSGAEALEAAAQVRPDLVLMDIHIQGRMDGIETAEKIREEFDIPIVYVTALGDAGTLQRAKLTRPYGYIIKPFSEKDLGPAIEIALMRHSLESKVRESERWLSGAFRSLQEAVFVTDLRALVAYMNPAAEGLTGWAQSEALGQDVFGPLNLVENEDGSLEPARQARFKAMPAAEKARTAIQGGSSLTLERLWQVNRQGERQAVAVSMTPIRNDVGQIVGAVLICSPERESDGLAAGAPSDAALAQLAIRNSQLAAQVAQWVSLGVMASGISLEMTPSLHAILVNAASVLFWHKRNPGLLPEGFIRKIDDIAADARRIEGMLLHLPLFSAHPGQQESEWSDLNELITRTLSLIQRRLQSRNIRTELALMEGSLEVRDHDGRWEYVLINLLTCAMASLDRSDETDKWIRIATRAEGGQGLVELQDNGVLPDGLHSEGAAAGLKSGHDPFVSVPGWDESMNLRLSIAKLLTEEMKGQIEAIEKPEGGMTYVIKLPSRQSARTRPQ